MTSKKKIIINLIDYYEHQKKSTEILNGVGDFLLSTKDKHDIEIISFCPDLTRNEDYLNNIIQGSNLKNEKIKIITEFENTKEFLKTFSKANITVNMRYHGTLLSMVYGIPSINIIYDIHPHYPNKMNYLAKIFKEEEYFINFTDVNNKNIKEMLLKANKNQLKIHEKIIKQEKIIKTKLENNYKQIFK